MSCRFSARHRPRDAFFCKIDPGGAVSESKMLTMSLENPRSLLTRASLLFRIRDWEDSNSWEEFDRLYRRFVYGVARRSGLSHAESEDVVQDVFKRVAETIQNFESNPERGSFRGWLMNLTRWRITDKFRARPPEAQLPPRRDDATGTGTLDRLPDPNANDDAVWETEWQQNILDAALARLARRVPAKHFQAFELYARQQWPVLRVSRELGLNPASVYLINHRLTKQLKAEVARLQSQLG
jgi:RNA polymerase sigma-70 factor (ECF subfamily)